MSRIAKKNKKKMNKKKMELKRRNLDQAQELSLA